MTTKSSKFIPFLVLAITAGLLGIDAFTNFEVNETHATIVLGIMSTLGLGGVYNKAFKEGFSKFQKIKEDEEKTTNH